MLPHDCRPPAQLSGYGANLIIKAYVLLAPMLILIVCADVEIIKFAGETLIVRSGVRNGYAIPNGRDLDLIGTCDRALIFVSDGVYILTHPRVPR